MKSRMRMAGRCGILAMAVLLSACTVEPATQAALDAYRLSRSSSGQHRLDPALRYLRVMVADQENLLVLGYVDPSAANGPVQVWYSRDRNVLRLRDGRLVGASIRDVVDWSGVNFTDLPSWETLGERAEFVRVRDVNPGYRYGIRDMMHIQRVPAPGDSNLAGISPDSLSWYEERVIGGADDGLMARYAVEHAGTPVARAVYGEQCLTREFCLSWQVWPPAGGEGGR